MSSVLNVCRQLQFSGKSVAGLQHPFTLQTCPYLSEENPDFLNLLPPKYNCEAKWKQPICALEHQFSN